MAFQSLPAPILSHILASAHGGRPLQLRLLDRATNALLQQPDFLELLLVSVGRPRMASVLTSLESNGDKPSISRAAMALIEITPRREAQAWEPLSPGPCTPLRRFVWVCRYWPVLEALHSEGWIEALARVSVPPEERRGHAIDSKYDWEYARKYGEEIPVVGSGRWCKLLDSCTVRLGLVPCDCDEAAGSEHGSHLGGCGLWPEQWLKTVSFELDDQAVKLRRFDECVLPACDAVDQEPDGSWQLVAQLDLDAIDRLVNEHWPLGGCPWPWAGRQGMVYLVRASDKWGEEEAFCMFWPAANDQMHPLGPNHHASLCREISREIIDHASIDRGRLLKFCRKVGAQLRRGKQTFSRPLSKAIQVRFSLEASVPNFLLREMEWTVRDWFNQMQHQRHNGAQAEGEHQAPTKHWLFGYPETHNPETRMEAHELLLQSWSDRRTIRGWCWGDLDALLLSTCDPHENSLQIQRLQYEVRG